jgi:hypothetical protein
MASVAPTTRRRSHQRRSRAERLAKGFHPVAHTSNDTARLARPGVKAAYDALQDKYTALSVHYAANCH